MSTLFLNARPSAQRAFGPEVGNHIDLLSRYTYEDCKTILIESGVGRIQHTPDTNQVAAADSGSGEGGQGVFNGGKVYTITAGEQTIIEAITGYDATWITA